MSQNQVAKLEPKRSPLAAMAERLSIDANELQGVIMKTVMPANQNVSNEQFVSFLAVANSYALDPLKKEIYAFPANGGIQPIVSIDGWLSIINSRPEYDGMELTENYDDNGKFVSVTCKIYRNDRNQPTIITEDLAECIRNTPPWKKPKRMLRHKAVIQCARYAFGLGGIMEEDEAAAAFGEREVNTARPAQAAAPEPQEIPAYPAEKFAENLPKWQRLIEGGRKTVEEVIATVEANGTLTDEQKDKIRDLAPIDVDTETGEVQQ